MHTASRSYRERVLSLGQQADIISIITEPDSEKASLPLESLPALIFLNAGVLHRVGPHRLHVSLARSLAVSGFTSLRLDLSGIGDSRVVPGTQTFRASAVADTRTAMDEISNRCGIDHFMLIGLCSGADNALATADADPRVVGLILIDAPAYSSWQARIRMLLSRLRRVQHVGANVRRRLSLIQWQLKSTASAHAPADQTSTTSQGRQLPSRHEYGELLTRLLTRGVRILTIYSGALGERCNHREQLFEVFPRLRNRLDTEFFPRANHVFTELAQRRELMQAIGRWCNAWKG